jgi:hypothetical protein
LIPRAAAPAAQYLLLPPKRSASTSADALASADKALK